ncbi:putative lactoylglutathione lyase [Kribbella antiqua]|uniref:Putative lactoylglutathione lyase n=1 Tax=Kribbella antiqua TaxID=2512217 RepID=A0A4R2J329_9ACTN|nr:VOC family protein [Kribbella antiqua]TCO51316.1 putative lactoylglutathione lyase [Kribbella antiqua]
MDTKLKAVVVPVSDVDRTRHFYRALGFHLDSDQADGEVRAVQLTPAGSLCSIIIGTGISPAEPGSAVGVLRVNDLRAAVAELQSRGAAPSPISRDPAGLDQASFTDPDGNRWLLVA